MTEPATDLYMDALRGLTRYGFRRISFIRNLAEDNKNNQAVNFVAAVQTFMHEVRTRVVWGDGTPPKDSFNTL
jgi:hypothetical protein